MYKNVSSGTIGNLLLQEKNHRKRRKSEWKLDCHKRIIREKDAKEIFFNNRTEVAQLLIT